MADKTSFKQEVIKEFEQMKPGDRFQSDELEFKIRMKTGVSAHVDTILRYLREYRRETGRMIENVNKSKSIYEVLT